jgi:DNA invertase Pin-like site-specific DNA recombinase
MFELKVAHDKPWEGARFGLYGRVSTPDQSAALDAQLSFLRNEVTSKKGHIVAEHCDVGTGRRSKQRTGYQQMLKLIEQRAIDYLFVRDLSRLSRKFGTLDDLWHFSRQNGVVLVDGQIGVIDGLICWALGLVAQVMPAVGGEQVRTSLAVKARKGLHLGRPPLGYECVEKDGEKGHLEIVEEDARIVRRIFERALAGVSLRGQAQILNFKDKVPSPRDALWTSETVRYILTNPVYRKDIVWGRTRNFFHAMTEAFKRDYPPEAEWIRALGTHEPLVSEADFDRVQEILARNETGKKNKKVGPPAFLSSLIKCPDCSRIDDEGNVQGGSMSVVGGDGRRLRMRCINANVGKCNNRRTFYRDQILQAVLGGLLDHLKSPRAMEMFLQEHNAASERRLAEVGPSRGKAEKRIKVLETEIKRLVDQLAKGINADELQGGITLRKDEKFKLTAQLEDIENSSVIFALNPPSLADYASMAERMMANLSGSGQEPEDIELREHLEALVKHVYVHPLVENGKKTFEVEVFGKLATLVTGAVSYRAQHRKDMGGKDILTRDIITTARAAQKLVMAFPRKRGSGQKPPRNQVLRRLEPDLARILSDSLVPMTARVIVSKLAEEGIWRTITGVHNALNRRPDTFVRIRKNGFMLRSRWAKQPVRYFTTTAEIVAVAREVLGESRKPMRPEEILKRFHEKGPKRRIFGDELAILRNVLSKHADDFEAKGRQNARWILRTDSDIGSAPTLAA